MGWPSLSRAGPPPKAVGVFFRSGRVSVDKVQRDPGAVCVGETSFLMGSERTTPLVGIRVLPPEWTEWSRKVERRPGRMGNSVPASAMRRNSVPVAEGVRGPTAGVKSTGRSWRSSLSPMARLDPSGVIIESSETTGPRWSERSGPIQKALLPLGAEINSPSRIQRPSGSPRQGPPLAKKSPLSAASA